MRTTSILVAALVAASSVAAQQETRRIYYPRHIKRQFTNVTITSDTPSPSGSDESKTQSTKRQDVLGNLPLDLDPPTDVKVTTIVVQSTVFVAPTPTPNPNPFANGTAPDTTDKTTDDSFTLSPTSEPTTSPDRTTLPETLPIADTTSDEPKTEPTAGRPTVPDPDKANSNSTVSATFDSIVSVAPTTLSTSSIGIVIAPTGVVTESTSTTPEPTTAPTTTEKNPLDPLTPIVSDVVSVITSLAPPLQNATETKLPEPTSSPIVTIPDITPSGTGPVTTPPPIPTSEPPSETVTSPPVSPTVIVDPPPVTNTTEPPPPVSSTSVTSEPPPPPTTSPTVITEPPPPPPSSTFTPNVTISANTTTPAEPTTTDEPTGPGVTSIPHLGTTSYSQSWLPTTILVDPTSTTVVGGLAPTTATGIPTAYPKAITPETAQTPLPDDVQLIQIGLLEGYNYPFVVGNTMAAAQIFDLLPKALSYAGGFNIDKVQMRKLVPLDTGSSMGYITTLCYVTYPKSLVEALQLDIKMPASSLYNNPEMLVYNFTKQINPAIQITIGSYPDDIPGTGSGDTPSSGTATPNGDPFSNEGTSGKSSSQQGTTAGIVTGAVAVAAAYGAAMFIIARRYKRKKQSHRRASSISNPSDMQQTPRSSPALMGGALLSRDFTGYGGVTGGRDSHGTGSGRGGRDSHGSGRSGMGNSARTQYISAPVAAENSLGWN